MTLLRVIMDNAKLLAQIQSNTAIINTKIRSLQNALNSAPAIVRSNSEREKEALRAENEALKKDITNLVGKLTSLEAATGAKQVASAANCYFNTRNNEENIPKPVLTKQSSQSPKRERHVSFSDDPPAVTEVPPTEPPAKGKKDKKEKKAKEGASAVKTAGGDDDSRIDVSRLDLRIGRIISAKKHPDADSLYVEEVDLGEAQPRTVVSGLVKFVSIEEMQNRMALLMCNLKPAKMRGVLSEAMVMCASTPEKVEILVPPEGAQPGDRIVVEGFPGEPDGQLNPKKKIWEQVAPDLKTNEKCEATYKGVVLAVPGKGVVKAPSLANVQIK